MERAGLVRGSGDEAQLVSVCLVAQSPGSDPQHCISELCGDRPAISMFSKSRQEDKKFKVYPGLKEEGERWKGKGGRSDGYRSPPTCLGIQISFCP